ncbi:VCBS repeat-containing protein [Acidobacteria bacterium AH-259-D05]|nr:VCBS repeat-containing protein [Acidobacteria bacterium AH-259-D05]
MVEDRTEAFANQMLKLSRALRTFNTIQVADFFTNPSWVTPLPTEATDLVSDVKWVQRHGWRPRTRTKREMTREEIGRMWEAFLAHFSELEDARFKVVQATFDEEGQTGEAELKFFLIGRDPNGLREWIQGTAAVTLERAQGDTWAIQGMMIDCVESLLAATDVFSEVSEPAGVSARLPLLGAQNSRPYSFYWHGAAAVDIDLDGDADLFVTADYRNYLYLNDGAGKFREASAEASLQNTSDPEVAGGTAPLLLDIDNDGDSDLFLSMWDKQKLFENRLVPDGQLIFRDISEESGVAVRTNGLSAVAADINNDGLPDIYVCGYGRFDHPETGLTAFYRPGNGGRNLLFVNQGHGRFREMAKEYGVDDPRWSQAAAFFDFEGDGDQDLYVSNDWGDNALYLNEGNHFRDATLESGASKPGFGMGVSLGDYDNDGDLDIHASYMSSTAGSRVLALVDRFSMPDKDLSLWHAMAAGNRIYENLGKGTFRDVSEAAGPFLAGWAWGGGFLDLDNDGWQDLHSPNGLWSGRSQEDT